MIRVGQGYDVHRFNEGDHIILGGVKIPYDQGLEAHSDGDVVLHALCDAMLGALGLGDIGDWFSPSDPQWKGAASRVFVEKARDALQEKGYQVVNADITVMLETPKLGPHKALIGQTIADLLKTTPDRVSIKAKTMEGLGPIGEGLALSAMATVLVEQSP